MGILANMFAAQINELKTESDRLDIKIAADIQRCHDLIESCNLEESLIED